MKTVKFKDSPLGPIPQEWEVKRLGEIGEPVMCKRVLKSQTSDSGAVPFYKIGTFGDKADAYISRSLYEDFKEHYPYPRKGDVLVSAAGTIGRTVVFDGNEAYFQDSNIVWIDHDESKVLNIFLCLCYKNMRWQSEDGGIISRLYNANLKAQKIPLPPLPEQRRIAEALGEMDRLIELLDAQIVKKRHIAQGLAHDLLGMKNEECGMRNEPIRRLPGFKGEWVKKILGSVIEFATTSIATSKIDAEKYVSTDNMVPNLGGVVPNTNAVSYASVREYKTGDILLSNIRPYLKKMWWANWNAGCSTDVLVLRLVTDSVDSRFLYHTLSRDKFFDFVSSKAVGTKMPRGDKRVIASFQIQVPTLAEQRAIAEVLAAADAEIAALETKREKYKKIKAGMMRDLLSGRVRVNEECGMGNEE